MADDHPHQSVADLRSQVMVAAAQGDVQAVSALLQNCASHIQDEILTRGVYEGSVMQTAVENHKMDIVKLLVQKFNVDINATTLFTPVDSNSAMFYAIRKENEELVREFVNLGANVNIVSGAQTPLMLACDLQSIRMVTLLIELHANVNLHRGLSPLMILSIKDEPLIQLIEALLDSGADYNWQNHDGDTALHLACKVGKNAVVQILLQKQAQILPNKFGLTPPLLAAERSNKQGILGMFLDNDALSREEKINALEFRAASLAPDDLDGAYKLLHETLEERFKDPSNILKKPICEPVAAFRDVVESQSLEELETRKDNLSILLMECLAVQHRLLGRAAGTMCKTNNFYRIWEKLFSEGLHEQAMALAEHGIGTTPSKAAVSIFSRLLELQNLTIQSPGISVLSFITRGLHCCIRILRVCEADHKTYLKLCLKLLNCCIQLDLTDEQQTAKTQARDFLNSFPLRLSLLSSALHATNKMYILRRDDADFPLSMYKSVVDILVKCDADVNERDTKGYTVLAYVLHCMTPGDNRREVVEFLLKKGANAAYLRGDDERPADDYVKDADVVDLLWKHYPLP